MRSEMNYFMVRMLVPRGTRTMNRTIPTIENKSAEIPSSVFQVRAIGQRLRHNSTTVLTYSASNDGTKL